MTSACSKVCEFPYGWQVQSVREKFLTLSADEAETGIWSRVPELHCYPMPLSAIFPSLFDDILPYWVAALQLCRFLALFSQF